MRLLTLFALLFASHAGSAEKIVARVVGVKGNAFAFEADGSSKRLAFGGRIRDMAEVMVDDGSYVSVLDGEGNEHHLSGGTYAKFYNKLLEIKNGSVWTVVQGRQAMVNTVNSVVKGQRGQFIVSVDNGEPKTQVLTVTGQSRLSSALEPRLSIGVPAGHFSFIDRNYESGLPRAPTRVGLKSYKSVKKLFANVKGLEKKDFEKSFFVPSAPARERAPKRSVASVAPKSKKGRVIYIKTHGKRAPASVQKSSSASAMEYYQSLGGESEKGGNKKTSRKKKINGPRAKIRYFGFSPSKQESAKVDAPQARAKGPAKEKAGKRKPASAGGAQRLVNDINSAFEESLNTKVESNKRHPDEVNQLIDELKSFKRDYSKHY